MAPRPSNTPERRRQLVEALLDLMAERGYDGTSVAEIAARAGLNQGLVYYHFKRKLDVLLAALEVMREQHMVRLDGAMRDAGGDPWAQLDGFINAHLGLTATADERALKCWIDVAGEALREPEVQAPYRRILSEQAGRLAGIIAGGVEAGAFRAEPEAAAIAILATIEGYLLIAGTSRDAIPYGTAALSTMAMARGLVSR